MKTLLKINNLSISFKQNGKKLRAVDDISFSIGYGEMLAVVGESGCGKSVTSLSILRLLNPKSAEVEGEILFEGKNLLALPESEIRKVRGKEISMVFQEPMTSLNPVMKIGEQIGEAVRIHEGGSKAEIREKVLALLTKVGIPAPNDRIDDYPFQLSGGMRQRVMIAMALSCSPKLLIADEPTTALDVTIQAQILDLMVKLQREMNMSVMLVTHDLGVVAETARNVIVMYAGRLSEYSSAEDIFKSPIHPYTIALLNSMPKEGADKDAPLPAIAGVVPSLHCLPFGCYFQDRCPYAIDRCRTEIPTFREVVQGRFASCHRAEEIIELRRKS